MVLALWGKGGCVGSDILLQLSDSSTSHEIIGAGIH
jgi:predicted aconitase with swiveling domain